MSMFSKPSQILTVFVPSTIQLIIGLDYYSDYYKKLLSMNRLIDHPAKLFSHLVAIYIVCYEMGASAHYFNTYQYLHI